MAFNIKRYIEGIALVPKSSTSIDTLGEIEVLLSDSKLRFHNGSSTSPVVTEIHASQGTNRLKNKDVEDSTFAIVDISDTTKKILFNAAGTAGTSTTITGSQTSNQVLTLPDATDTLVGKATSDVLTNKSIDSDNNTITNIVNADIKAAAGIVYSKLTLTNSIVDADVYSAAAITRSKLASGTAYRLLANNSSGVMSENAALTATHVIYADANGQLAGEATLATSRGGLNLSSYTTGDLIYASSSSVLSKLGIGSTGQSLVVAAGLPSWGVSLIAGGGTGLSSYTQGDMLYYASSTALSKLAIGSSNKVITSSGTAPAWNLIVNANIDAAAAIAYSKLNLATSIVNADVSASAAIDRSKLASGSASHVLINDGSGVMSSEAALAITRGGTGAATALAGFNALSPLSAKGDILTHNGTNNVKKTVGADGTIITADSSVSEGWKWASLPSDSFQGGKAINLGMAYDAGTGVFTVQSADGTALSAGNPAYVYLQGKATPGQLVRYTVTANQSFIDDTGASEIIGNLFGATTGIAWANDCPFFLYAVGDDTETSIAFMISRDPRATISPTTIGKPSSAAADTEPSFFSIDNVTTTSYDANPCLCLGAFRMRMSASDDWTVQALTNQDGIGRFHESTAFTYPQNQNGADANTHLDQDGGGTIPQFTTESYQYWVYRDGKIKAEFFYTGDAGTDGSGAVGIYMTLPTIHRGLASIRYPIYVNSVGGGSVISFAISVASSADLQLASQSANYTCGNFSNGARTISGSVTYPAFTD